MIINICNFMESYVTDYSRMENGGSINKTFDKNCIIDNKSTPLQLCMRHKSWVSTGNIHIRFRLSERGTHGVWLKGINNVPASCLVDELEGDFVCERPLEDVVELSTHHHKEQREVSALPSTIPHDVETKTHLVAIPARVEGQGEH